jgi:hypothetical protein
VNPSRATDQAAAANEAIRLRRLREDARRPIVDPDPANLKRVAEVAIAAGGHVQRGDSLLGSAFSIAAEMAGGEQVAIESSDPS